MTSAKPNVGAQIEQMSFLRLGSEDKITIGQKRTVGQCCLSIGANIARAASVS